MGAAQTAALGLYGRPSCPPPGKMVKVRLPGPYNISPVVHGPCDGLGWADVPESGPRFDQIESQVPHRPVALKLQSQGFSWSLCLLKTPEATSPTGASSARMLLAPGLWSCWEYTGSINKKCRLVVSALTPASACNRPLNFAALGSWGASSQDSLRWRPTITWMPPCLALSPRHQRASYSKTASETGVSPAPGGRATRGC